MLRFCADVDECSLSGICVHGDCINLDGSYSCSCNLGYQATLNGKACEGAYVELSLHTVFLAVLCFKDAKDE